MKTINTTRASYAINLNTMKRMTISKINRKIQIDRKPNYFIRNFSEYYISFMQRTLINLCFGFDVAFFATQEFIVFLLLIN